VLDPDTRWFPVNAPSRVAAKCLESNRLCRDEPLFSDAKNGQ
jgi:hypothetical protein